MVAILEPETLEKLSDPTIAEQMVEKPLAEKPIPLILEKSIQTTLAIRVAFY